MKYKLTAFLVGFGFVFGLIYDKPSKDSKLKCDRCNNTYFTVSQKTAKFVGLDDTRVLKSASFYKCTKCGVLSDVIASK